MRKGVIDPMLLIDPKEAWDHKVCFSEDGHALN